MLPRVVEDVSSVRRAFSLTYVLTYGKTYGGTYVGPYALTGGAYIYLVTPSIVRPLLPHWCVCLVSLLYKKPQPQGELLPISWTEKSVSD